MTLLVSAVLLSLAWLSPTHFPPWISWHNEIWAFAAVMWSMGALLFSKDGIGRPVSLPRAGWPLLLLALVVVIQTISGQITFVGDAWVLLFYFALCIGAMGFGYRIGGSETLGLPKQASAESAISQFAMLVVAGGLCSVAVELVQALDIWDTAIWIHRMPGPRRPGAHLGQTNQLASFILFSIASLIYLFEYRHVRVILALPMTAILLLGLAMTESRTGALSLLLMAGWWVMKRRQLGFMLSFQAIALWLILYACFLWFWPSCLNFIFIGGAGEEFAQINLRAGTRLLVWPQLWQAVMQRPWFGWGLHEVPQAYNAVLHAYAKGENFTYAHNIFLDLAVGMGLPLTFLLLVVTAKWLWRRAHDSDDLRTWYCLALILPFVVHSMLEFPFAYAYLLVPVMFLLGVLESSLAPAHVVRIRWWSATLTWALISIAMVWSVLEYIEIEEDFRVARFEVLNIGKTETNYERPKIVLLTQMGAMLEGVRLVPTPGMTPQRMALARNVAMRFPGPATQTRYAVSLALNGDAAEATRQLLVMRAMHGEKAYLDIISKWETLTKGKYPQLGQLNLPGGRPAGP